jgi:hypothetical protein
MLNRRPFQGLPKLTDQNPAPPPLNPNGPPQSYTPLPPAPGGVVGGNGLPNTPFNPNLQNASSVTGQGVTSTIARQSPYAAPEEWYKEEWMKFSIPEQRQMSQYLPHELTLIFAARRYGDNMVTVVNEETGLTEQMTGMQAATKIAQMADARLHQGYLDKRAGNRAEMGIRQQQEIPFRVTAA